MPVIVTTGDGDCYGEGGNHLLAAMRRNINVKLFVHDNQIYGLTKGQPSPTTGEGIMAKNTPLGVISGQFNPLALAVALDCSFAARVRRDTEHLKGLMKAMNPGFSPHRHPPALRHVQQGQHLRMVPHRVYRIEPGTIPKTGRPPLPARSNGDRIPLGVIYRHNRPSFEERLPMIAEKPLVHQVFDASKIEGTLKEFT
jgi:2-oxoglutarate ferredoxin oxidoreductase subunit beta